MSTNIIAANSWRALTHDCRPVPEQAIERMPFFDRHFVLGTVLLDTPFIVAQDSSLHKRLLVAPFLLPLAAVVSSSGVAATVHTSTATVDTGTGRTKKPHPTRCPGSHDTNILEEFSSKPKRERRATAVIPKYGGDGAGGGSGAQRTLQEEGEEKQQQEETEARNRGERSRRRLAALLEGRASIPEAAADAATVSRGVRSTINRPTSPPLPVATVAGGGVHDAGSGTGGGGMKEGLPSEWNARCVRRVLRKGFMADLITAVIVFVP